MSELNSEGNAELYCYDCGTHFDAHVINTAGACEFKIHDHPDTVIHAEDAFYSPPDEDEWVNVDLPSNPHSHFLDSYHHVGDILANHGGESGDHLINRMVFSQMVGAFEAYLGDTILSGIDNNPEGLKKLITNDRKIKSLKFDLAEVSDNPNLVRDTVRTHLRRVIYHDLLKVDSLYNIAFGIKLLTEKDVNSKLLLAVQNRHHCVHRNGFDSEGNRLTVFTKEYVQETADLICGVVDRIQLEMYGPPPF